MSDGVFDVQAEVEIQIDIIDGDLYLEGASRNEIRAMGDQPNIRIQQDGRSVYIRAQTDCRLRIPRTAKVTINSVAQDAVIKNIVGEITINNIGSDAKISDTGPLTIATVGGDAHIKNITGKVQIETVGGDARITDVISVMIETVGGDLEVKRTTEMVEVADVGGDANFKKITGVLQVGTVGGDVLIESVNGNCTIETIGSDLVLDTTFAPDVTHAYQDVGGDVLAKLVPGTSVRFIVDESVERVMDVRTAQTVTEGDQTQVILAEGKATVKIETIGGELQLINQGEKRFGRMVEEFVENAIPEDLGETIGMELENAKQEMDRAFREAERIRQRSEKFRQEAERAANKAKRDTRSWNFNFSGPKNRRGPNPPMPPMPPTPPMPPMPNMAPFGRNTEPASEPITDQERMMILRMVENKQISVEEAERLLAALEGRD